MFKEFNRKYMWIRNRTMRECTSKFSNSLHSCTEVVFPRKLALRTQNKNNDTEINKRCTHE